MAHWTLFRPLKDKLGLSQIRLAVTGSSVLSLDTFRLIHALGIELRQVYASTEAGFISSHSNGEVKFETVGRPALGTEVRLTDEGELLVRSDCMFTGYLNNEKKTAETFINGWCHTNDAVNIDDTGHLVFLDRLEHLGVLSSGVKYAPQYIEGRLRFSPYIKDAMVVGGKDKSFVSAIINIDFTMVGKWAERNHVPYTTFVDLSQRTGVADLVRKDLQRVNSYLPEQARVKKFVLMHKEFDPDEAELTRTRKLRREFMEEKYRELIQAMYGNLEELPIQANVTYRDGRKGTVSTTIKVRNVDGGNVKLGQKLVTLPSGAAIMALRTGARLIPCGLVRTSNTTFHGIIGKPIEYQPSGKVSRDIQGLTQLTARSLEDIARAFLDQWYVFHPLIKDELQDISEAPDPGNAFNPAN